VLVLLTHPHCSLLQPKPPELSHLRFHCRPLLALVPFPPMAHVTLLTVAGSDAPSTEEATALLKRAYELGVRLFNTSDLYGESSS